MTDNFQLDRRTLMTGAAMTGAAMTGAALTMGAPGGALAAAPKQGLSRPNFYRFGLGDFEVTSILDGAIQLDGPHPIFGQNTTQEEVAALAAGYLEPLGEGFRFVPVGYQLNL